MIDDLISDNFVENVNKVVIKKAFNLSKIVLSFTIIYAVVELYNWYEPIINSMKPGNLSNIEYYTYRFLPVIDVILLSSSILSWSYCVKANKLINLSFEKNDADFFNVAYKYFYRSGKITFTIYFIGIASLLARHFLK